ncbi:RidA family protein [Campylobacter avium]|uniref:RidA family protein n=1 Tax=Campylobacter avium TaxID=522485 RepID=UPI0023557B6E|nr:RidA family protein [Campylobacter avium]
MKRFLEDKRMSQLILHNNGFFETAGQVSLKEGIKAQTQESLEKIDELLKLLGATKDNLSRIQIWLNDINDFEAMNEVYELWLKDSFKPVRACVGATLVKGYLVEIQAFGLLNLN